MSSTAKKAKGRQIRAWHLNRRSGSDLSGLAQGIRSEAGSTTTGPSTAPYCTPWQGASMSISCGGPCRSSSDCAADQPGRGGGWTPLDGANPPCSPTGICCLPPHGGLWEPYDGRPSRTVLREREGEAPSRYSPWSRPGRRGWSPRRGLDRGDTMRLAGLKRRSRHDRVNCGLAGHLGWGVRPRGGRSGRGRRRRVGRRGRRRVAGMRSAGAGR
jgi:hypothetical protein